MKNEAKLDLTDTTEKCTSSSCFYSQNGTITISTGLTLFFINKEMFLIRSSFT